MSNIKDLRVSLDEGLREKIESLKLYYGVKNTTELIRLIITEKYREIIKE